MKTTISNIGYRTIGDQEFHMLFDANNPVFGLRRWQDKPECGADASYPYGIVCFFIDPIGIQDADHKIEISVRLHKPIFGVGDYDVSKDFEKTHTITFRGKQNVHIPEAYMRCYSLKDVESINLKGYFGRWYANSIEEKCKKLGIEFHNTRAYHFNMKNK